MFTATQYSEENILTRQVLIEKAPFCVEISDGVSESSVFYNCVGNFYMVRPIRKRDKTLIGSRSGKDFYKIIGFGIENHPENNINDLGCLIKREWCKVVSLPPKVKTLPEAYSGGIHSALYYTTI
jgi:hypothetical protein